MVKKTPSNKDPHRVERGKVNTVSLENHMQVFARLAKITVMHGHPGERKKKGGK